jgi:hypothetical protein
VWPHGDEQEQEPALSNAEHLQYFFKERNMRNMSQFFTEFLKVQIWYETGFLKILQLILKN